MTAFLFDESNDDEEREEPFYKALGSATTSSFRSRVFCGSLLLHSFARQLAAGERRPDRTSYSYRFDKRIFKTLAVGLGADLAAQSTSIADDVLRMSLYAKQLWCFALPNCTTEIANKVDRMLRTSTQSYLGRVDVDLGSPLQYQLFVSMLSDAKQIDGRILYESWPEPQLLDDYLSPYNRIAVQEFEFQQIADQVPQPTSTTPSGARLLARYLAAVERGKEPLITRAVSQAFIDGANFAIGSLNKRNVRQSGRELSPEALRSKLELYALNPQSDRGQHKARVFASALGITVGDWLYLAAQIARAAPSGRIYQIEETPYGVQFKMQVDVSGLNQSKATVVTRWIIEGNDVRFVTAYVDPGNNVHAANAPRSLRVGGETPALRYHAILELAHQQGAEAAANEAPTPNLIEVNGRQYEVPELGLASVLIKDARRSFARWLLRTKNADRGYKGGALVHVRTEDQSLERSEAYAQAFANVLRENAVQCEVISHSD